MNARPRIPMQDPECETVRSWLDVHSDNVRSRIGALGWTYTASADNVRSRIPSLRGLGWTCTVIMWRSCYFLAMYYENDVMLCCTWSSFSELGQAHYKYMFYAFNYYQKTNKQTKANNLLTKQHVSIVWDNKCGPSSVAYRIKLPAQVRDHSFIVKNG